ncbi:serine-rich adhesin for platelets isoform X10 [Drosophila hydei]|uniref:Serine-rich adhesin for platelets isoform X10 n=1 Tax=Drosophila hydei TaxID=7224 RepID=A0A6J1MLD9_DROHY|nr:serine-rich adhesin for platelets isoform X10 [Drosophila hydei]
MGLMRSLCCCFTSSESAGESGDARPAYRKCPDEDQEGETETATVSPKATNEIEQSLAAAISDRATDEVLEALTRYRRGHGISESPSVLLDEPQTPDIVRSRSSHEAEGLIIRPGGRGSVLPKLGLESPTATPHLPSKRRSIARKVRPQSVVENLSLSHIPDLLESPSSHRSNSQLSSRGVAIGSAASAAGGGASAINMMTSSTSNAAMDDGNVDEGCDSITELPSASFQLQHLVKGRPKRAKTRAPTRPLVNAECAVGAVRDIGDGLEHFFRPGSVTPTTLTPLVSPTSEECSSLSFVDSPTMSRDGNGHMTSEETTPILEERRPIKLERQSPLLKSASWATRSRSTDNLEKYSPLVGRKSPLVKMRTEGGAGNEEAATPAAATGGLLKAATRDEKMRSPSSDSIKSHATGSSSLAVGTDGSLLVKTATGNGILRTPIALQKPRPWSVVGTEPKANNEQLPTGNGSVDSSKTTPDTLEEDVEVLSFGQGVGGSIVGITPGIALASGGSGGGSIVGITPGAALEKKSVRELAAGLSRLDLPIKPPIMPRTMLNTGNRASNSSSTSSMSSNTANNMANTTTMTTTTTVLNNQTRSKIVSTSSTNTETQETLSKTIITEHGSSSSSSSSSTGHAIACANLISNEILSMRNGQLNKANSCAESNAKRIAGKEISTLFEV